jgi:hypothetical protein
MESTGNTDYKERLEALRRAGFTTLEITRLYKFRRAYMANELDQAPADLARLKFVRWLVVNGKLTDQLA